VINLGEGVLEVLKAVAAKATAGWVGYAATAVVATGVTGGSIVGLSASGVIDITSGFGQQLTLPFTFKPAALGSLDQVYGSLTAGASAALTGAGIQLPQLAISNKIAAVSSKIVAEASADKASLQKLAETAQKLQGFKPSEETEKRDAAGTTTATPLGIATLTTATVGPTTTLTALPATTTATPTTTQTATQTASATASATPTETATLTVTATATPTGTVTETVTPTPTGSITVTPTNTFTPTSTFTPTPTNTPFVVCNGSGSLIFTMNNMIPGGPGVTANTVVCTPTGAHTFGFKVDSSPSAANLLWTDTTNGIHLAINRGGTLRDLNNPAVLPGGNSAIYSGPVQVANFDLALNVASGNSVPLVFTAWLPQGPSGSSANALTPNPGNSFQGLNLTVTFTITATENFP